MSQAPFAFSTVSAEGYLAEATTCGELLRGAARRWPESQLVFPGERASFRALDARADELAKVLLAVGAGPRENVGVLLPPSLTLIAALLAVAKIGATAVPISDRYKASELRYVIEDADLMLLVTTGGVADHPDYAGRLAEALEPRGRRLRRILTIAEADSFSDRAAGVSDDYLLHLQLAVRVSDLAFILYTSGTTAEPKGCMLTHEAVTRQAATAARTRYLLDSESTFWSPLQFFHVGGLSPLLSCLAVGASFCHVGRFDASVALEQLERERCTHAFPGLETIWLPILDHSGFGHADLSTLRLMVHGGTPEYLRKIQRRTPSVTVLSNYGSTEGAGSTVMTLLDDPPDVRADTNGYPLPGMELKIVDPATGEDLPREQPGEILFRGPFRFSGYYKAPELTAAAIDDDGWFHSGDRGTIDPDGRLTFLGRLKDMLKVGGENVAAAEVESYLVTHPAVNVVHVVGAPDAKYTEVPAAFVELTPGHHATEEEIIEYCVGRIASYKIPRYVRFLTEWPMSGTKVRKDLLRDRLRDELAALGIAQAPPVAARVRAR